MEEESRLDIVDAVLGVEPDAEDPSIGAGASSLDFLRAVYRSADQPMNRRMRAAVAALPFEHPKFAVIQTMSNSRDFAAQLEAARKRSAGALTFRPEIEGASAREYPPNRTPHQRGCLMPVPMLVSEPGR
jgi:hypothetical protein